jgi:hypothetical protein
MLPDLARPLMARACLQLTAARRVPASATDFCIDLVRQASKAAPLWQVRHARKHDVAAIAPNLPQNECGSFAR